LYFIRDCGLGQSLSQAKPKICLTLVVGCEVSQGKMDILHVSKEETSEFLQMWFYGTLNKVFETVCSVRELPADVAEELRRIVLQPNAVRVLVPSPSEAGERGE
jgi:hypothetical protein